MPVMSSTSMLSSCSTNERAQAGRLRITAVRLAKECFDVGLMVDPARFRLTDWTLGLGLDLDSIIELEGLRQHRFKIGEAVLKVNVAMDPLPDSAASGLTVFAIRGKRFVLQEGAPVLAPDLSSATESPRGEGLDIEIAARSVIDSMRFYTHVLGLQQVDSTTVRSGPGLIFFRRSEVPIPVGPLFGAGIRYLTFQVFDADEVCKAVEVAGGRIGRLPVNFADVARYGFVLDPDGNWIEISARASVIAAYQN